MQMSRKLVAEFISTFWLVLGGCGSAVLVVADHAEYLGITPALAGALRIDFRDIF